MQRAWRVFIVVVILAVLARIFIIDSFVVHGDSMSPTIVSGDYVFLNKYRYRLHDPQRGDIVVIKRSNASEGNLIKRIIGLPRELLEIGKNSVTIKSSRTDQGVSLHEPYIASIGTPEIGISREYLDPQEYFVMGDNRYVSIDSRELGPINSWDIKGRIFFLFRFKDFSLHYF